MVLRNMLPEHDYGERSARIELKDRFYNYSSEQIHK
jgi:hypothetical protein